MSRHRTLKVSSFAARGKNVLKRDERLKILAREGRWKEGQRITGLPKTRVPD